MSYKAHSIPVLFVPEAAFDPLPLEAIEPNTQASVFKFGQQLTFEVEQQTAIVTS